MVSVEFGIYIHQTVKNVNKEVTLNILKGVGNDLSKKCFFFFITKGRGLTIMESSIIFFFFFN